MYKVSKRTCTAIFLLIKPFVWRRSRCRRRRGLLKLPIAIAPYCSLLTKEPKTDYITKAMRVTDWSKSISH